MVTIMTPEEIAKVRAALDDITPLPWEWEGRTADNDWYVHIPQGSRLGDTLIALDDVYEGYQRDCDAITTVMNAAPSLLSTIEALRAEHSREYQRGRKDEQSARADVENAHIASLRSSLSAAEERVKELETERTSHDLMDSLHFAFRYALGRSTYAPELVRRAMRRYWSGFGPAQKAQIALEISAAAERSGLGRADDESAWLSFAREITAEVYGGATLSTTTETGGDDGRS